MAVDPFILRPGETRRFSIFFNNNAELRDYGEELTGTPTVTATPSSLTISSPGLVDIDNVAVAGDAVAVGVAFTVTGAVDATDYTVKATCATDGGSTLVEPAPLLGRASGTI